MGELWLLFREAMRGWREDRAASMGAALAYYTAFSLAPLLIISIAVASLFFGRDAAGKPSRSSSAQVPRFA
jgi:membrane protein